MFQNLNFSNLLITQTLCHSLLWSGTAILHMISQPHNFSKQFLFPLKVWKIWITLHLVSFVAVWLFLSFSFWDLSHYSTKKGPTTIKLKQNGLFKNGDLKEQIPLFEQPISYPLSHHVTVLFPYHVAVTYLLIFSKQSLMIMLFTQLLKFLK